MIYAMWTDKIEYRRTGFNCDNLIIANANFFDARKN